MISNVEIVKAQAQIAHLVVEIEFQLQAVFVRMDIITLISKFVQVIILCKFIVFRM